VCLEGVALFAALRQRYETDPSIYISRQPIPYYSLDGQRLAATAATASLDNVLTVLIEETRDHKWRWDIITDIPNLMFGSPELMPLETREHAEKAVIIAFAMFGQEGTPAEGHEPMADPRSRRQIRLNGDSYVVPVVPDEVVTDIIAGIMHETALSYECAQARVAYRLLDSNYCSEARKVCALTLLANCGWTHINEEVLENYCAANDLNVREAG
jgi:hypothetical protein